MRVAVIGGGLQGCCAALALADRGVKVTLFDKNEQLLTRAASANEGKVHLGYMYAGDRSLATAGKMITGALAFSSFLSRHLGRDNASFRTSSPALYLVHRESQRSVDEVTSYLYEVHQLLRQKASQPGADYFGGDVLSPLRTLPAVERDALFNHEVVLAAVETPEIAINPDELALILREAVAAHSSIEVRLRHIVRSVKRDGRRPGVEYEEPGAAKRETFDHVVNAAWEGRLAIDLSCGMPLERPWLHRLKYGVRINQLPMLQVPSATVVLGPYGEVVNYGDGLVYLTWYPDCLRGLSSEIEPPEWDAVPEDPLRTEIVQGTVSGLTNLVPGLRAFEAEALRGAIVKGGVIVAWGETDIYDPSSELHQRYEIGISSAGNYHSIDPGKLTMAPYFAEVLADRLVPQRPSKLSLSGAI